MKSPFFSLLNIFVIRSVIERVSQGAMMFLHLSDYPPLSISTEEIICKEKVIKGEEVRDLERCIEIDCSLLVGYKMRGYLFWHPKFTKWLIGRKEFSSAQNVILTLLYISNQLRDSYHLN